MLDTEIRGVGLENAGMRVYQCQAVGYSVRSRVGWLVNQLHKYFRALTYRRDCIDCLSLFFQSIFILFLFLATKYGVRCTVYGVYIKVSASPPTCLVEKALGTNIIQAVNQELHAISPP